MNLCNAYPQENRTGYPEGYSFGLKNSLFSLQPCLWRTWDMNSLIVGFYYS